MTSKLTMQGGSNVQAGGQGGFTLVELMITILISSLVLGVAYTVFSSQQKSYSNQQSVVDIQQNLRAGIYYLTREVRMAGYSENDKDPDGAITTAAPGVIQFTMDINNTAATSAINWNADLTSDGDVTDYGENITYALSAAGDPGQDGIADTEPCNLVRTDNSAGTSAILMNNVEAIGFAYAYDSDNDGRPETASSGEIIWGVDTDGDNALDMNLDANGDGTIGDTGSLGTTVDIDRICMVRIWILVRSSVLDSSFVDDNTYLVGYNQVVVNDNYRRRLLSTFTICRNMGGF